MVQLQQGVLVKSDEATIIYLLHYDDMEKGVNKFVLKKLDSKTLFVKSDKLKRVQTIIAHRLNETVFDEDEEAGQPYKANP